MTPHEEQILEAMLRGLPARQPPPPLDRRLAETWAGRRRVRRRLAASGTALLSLAVAASLLMALLPRQPDQDQAPPGPGTFTEIAVTPPIPPATDPIGSSPGGQEPVGPAIVIERAWCAPLDSQVVAAGDAPPVVHQHCQVTRDVQWIDKNQGVSIQWSISSNETAIVPLEVN